MKTFISFIGWTVLLAALLGVLGFIDFRLCVAPVGHCDAPAHPAMKWVGA